MVQFLSVRCRLRFPMCVWLKKSTIPRPYLIFLAKRSAWTAQRIQCSLKVCMKACMPHTKENVCSVKLSHSFPRENNTICIFSDNKWSCAGQHTVCQAQFHLRMDHVGRWGFHRQYTHLGSIWKTADSHRSTWKKPFWISDSKPYNRKRHFLRMSTRLPDKQGVWKRFAAYRRQRVYKVHYMLQWQTG